MKRTGIRNKLLKIFLVQILLISAVTIFGVLAAALITEEILIKQALQREADYFWERWRRNPDSTLPDTLNLRGYLTHNGERDDLPTWLANLETTGGQPSMRRVQLGAEQPIVYVSRQGQYTLYLVFDEKQVSRLSFFFGIVPLMLVLLVLYGLAYITFLQARRALSPITQLARRVEQHNRNPQPGAGLELEDLHQDADAETFVLVNALQRFVSRSEDFVNRERDFTRYASHELRTPLSVIKGSAANLAQEPLSPRGQRQLQRIQSTVLDIEALLEALLALAREISPDELQEPLLVNDLAQLLVDRFQETTAPEAVTLAVEHQALLAVACSPKLVQILLQNLLKNALAYTHQGQVRVTIDANGFSVEDTGIGITAQQMERIFEPFYRGDQQRQQGFGLGLAIVQRICNRLGWGITVESEPGRGTGFRVEVRAPV